MADDNLQKDLNMEISWILFGTGPSMINAFKEGELEIGYMGLPPAIIGIDKGVPIKCVAGGHIEGTLIIAKKGYKKISQFNDNIYEVLSQFKGKTIGTTSKGSIHDVILNFYIEENNLKNEITVKNYDQAEFIALDMRKGIIEGGVGTPALGAFASTIVKSHIIVPPEKLWKNNPSYGIFFRKDIIESNPELILKFLSYHKKASILIKKSPIQAAKIISNTIKILSENYVQSILKISPKYCIALSEGYVNATMEFVKILYKQGYIKRELQINDIFVFDFINKIHPENNHY